MVRNTSIICVKQSSGVLMNEYLDVYRWQILLFSPKIMWTPCDIYEDTGDSYDMPEPFVMCKVIHTKSGYELMVMVF